MKTITLLFFMAMSCFVANAQVDYSFAAQSGAYNSLSGATTAPLSAANPGGKPISDESFANNIPIGFAFQYNGINYSTIHLNANGWASLGAPFVAANNDPGYDVNELRAATGLRGATRPVLAPFWDNLAFTNTTDLTYKTEGSAPNRVFIAQWQNMIWQSGTSALSFQIKLYEANNVVEFVYRQEASAGAGAKSASIGITAEAGAQLIDDEVGNFLSVVNAGTSPTASATLETETITDRPATGQLYRFTPLSCASPAGLRAVSYSQSGATIQWTGRVGASGYQYGFSNLEVPPAGSAIMSTNQTTVNLTGLVPNTPYFVYVRSQCGSPWRMTSFRTPMTATVPYSEGFESALDNSLPRPMRKENLSSSFADAFWQSSNLLPAASGSKAAINSSPFVAAQTWLYTPGLNLTGGTAYKVGFKYATTGGTQGLEVKWGSQVGAVAMTNPLFDNTNISNTAYQTASASFTPPTTGIYYLGFLYKSDVNAGVFTLDDITVAVDPNPTTVAVTGVTVSPGSASVAIGQTIQLTATVAPANASNRNVSWTSANTAVATVNATGIVTGVAAGNAVITATTADGSRTATSTISVPVAPPTTIAVTGVAASPGSASVAIGQTIQLTATVAPTNATNQNVSWTSANTAIATVNASGVVTGVAAGNAVITVTTADGAKLATSTITVPAPVMPPVAGTGRIIRELWTSVGGTSVNNIPLTQPASSTSVLTSLEGPTNSGDNYGARIRGYIIPTTTGAYTFYIAGDDNSELYLSTNDSPAGKSRIAQVVGWTNSRDWTRDPTQKSAVINLVAGQRYYVEVLHKEGGGEDNVAVGWTGPGITAISIIGGANIAPFETTPPPVVTGRIIRELWSNVAGMAVSDIPLTQAVSSTSVLTSLEGPTDSGENYGARIRGYIIPTTTGAYTFYVAGDDNAELYLSTNNTVASKTRIAFVAGWTNSREWTRELNQKSAVINLVAGQRYYVEILHKEGGGGDHVAVGWTGPGITAITVIGGANISPFETTGSARLSAESRVSAEMSVQAYPNPVTNELTISGLAAPSLVEVMSYDGRVAKRHEQVENQQRLPMGDLATGLYILRVSNNAQGVRTIKVIKQ